MWHDEAGRMLRRIDLSFCMYSMRSTMQNDGVCRPGLCEDMDTYCHLDHRCVRLVAMCGMRSGVSSYLVPWCWKMADDVV